MKMTTKYINCSAHSALSSRRMSWILLTFVAISLLGSDEASGARNKPVYVKAQPIFAKPVKQEVPSSQNKVEEDPNRVTQTVYGFLDFVTTIGNTVMVFTPQTKKVEAVPVNPSVIEEENIIEPTSSSNLIPVVSLTLATKNTEKISSSSSKEPIVKPTSSAIPSTSDIQSPSSISTLLSIEPSETEELNFATADTIVASKPLSTVKLISVAPEDSTGDNFIEPESEDDEPKTQSISQTTFPKKVAEPKEKLGLVSKLSETKVHDGTTTLLETQVIGTTIGDDYVRLFKSTSSIIAPSATVKAFDNTIQHESTPLFDSDDKSKEAIFHDSREPDDKFGEEFGTEELDSTEEEDIADNQHLDDEDPDTGKFSVEPTPTASESQTHYILPQKPEPKAKIYVSPIPKPNSYSRQPKLYIDVSPAKSAEAVVTATPTRGKYSFARSSFANRFKKNRFFGKIKSRSSEQEEPTSSTTTSTTTTTTTPRSSFRSRNRTPRKRFRSFRSRLAKKQEEKAKEEATTVETVSATPATPSRRFGRNSKTFGGSRSKASKVSLTPTSSSSIYRFKLNRPTGRWRFKPSPKPKIIIRKTAPEDEEAEEVENKEDISNDSDEFNVASKQPIAATPKEQFKPKEDEIKVRKQVSVRVEEGVWPPEEAGEDEEVHFGNHTQVSSSSSVSSRKGPIYIDPRLEEEFNFKEVQKDSNELEFALEPSESLQIETVRVVTMTPAELDGKFVEVMTLRSPYVFQAGNVKNTRYITLTDTVTKAGIAPSATLHPTIENILATKAPYEKILEGSNDVATLPAITVEGTDATPPLEIITQTFSTSQLMLKTSILPVLAEGVTTLYTLTQSYFVTRLVTAHKTVPPSELFQFYPSKTLTEFNSALQEAGSEHREQLLSSEADDDSIYKEVIPPPDDLTLVGSDFDPSTMDERLRGLEAKKPSVSPQNSVKATDKESSVPKLPAGLTPEQLAFLQYFNLAGAGRSGFFPPVFPGQYQNPFQSQGKPQIAAKEDANAQWPPPVISSSPIVVDTIATVTDTKTLKILFGAKPVHTTVYSTKVIPTKVTSYVTTTLNIKPTALNNLFNAPAPAFPFSYLG